MADPGAYTQVNWQNKAAGGTKLGATNLNTVEEGLAALYNYAAKGSLWVASAAATVAELTVGANDTILVADSAQTGGVKWANINTLAVALSMFTAKGDIVAASASGAVDNLAVGTDGQVLTAASGETLGVDWTTVATVPSAFSPYTPAWTSSGSAPSLGSGTATGAYVELGKLVVGYFQITIAADSTAGTGTYRFSIPVAAAVTTSRFPMGFGVIRDTGTAQWSCAATPASSTTVELYVANGTTNHPVTTNTAPMAPATGDTYQVTFAYAAA